MEKKFHREEYPLDILAEYGLTESMIYDLPGVVHDTLEAGGYSPILPIKIQQKFGYSNCYARFRIIETADGLDVMFLAKRSNLPDSLNLFTEEQRSLLLDGKVIVADVEETIRNAAGEEEKGKIKAFVQYDAYTHNIIYNPTQIIGKNLTAISNEYDLTGEQLQNLWLGQLITLMEENESGIMEPVTIGVNLFSENGTVVIAGNEQTYNYIVNNQLPTYNFGNDGCWINSDGSMKYVKEEEFTSDIIEELNRRSSMIQAQSNLSQSSSERISEQENESYQLTR